MSKQSFNFDEDNLWEKENQNSSNLQNNYQPNQNNNLDPFEDDEDFSDRFEDDLDFNKIEKNLIKEADYKESKTFKEKIINLPYNSWIFIFKHRRFIGVSILVLIILGLIGGVFGGVWVFGIYNSIENIEAKATQISQGSIVYDKNGSEMFRYSGDVKREVVAMNQIPTNIQLAILALEDENFYKNETGIPWQNIAGAAVECGLARGNNCRGASGLSQQLIKNVTADDEQTLDRKVRELLTAIKFNQVIGDTTEEKQDKVLELYLNWVPFGRNNYGVQTASRSFFGHDVNSPELTIPKACYLASMVQRPSTFSEAIRLELINREKRTANQPELENPTWEILEGRKNACINKLYEVPLANRGKDYLIKTEAERDELKKQIVDFKPNVSEDVAFGHLKEYITNELITKFAPSEFADDFTITAQDLETKGYKIYTTFDKTMQEATEKIIREASEYEVAQANNAASVILDGPTGEVLVMVGSRDFNNQEIGGQVNVATAPRQPGSSFKPYVYASALNNGFNPGTVLLDVPMNFGNAYQPKNFSGTFSGITTIRRSLQDSLNIPAVKAAFLGIDSNNTEINPENSQTQTAATNNILDFANKMGVQTPYRFGENGQQCGLASSLGGCEVTMISHAAGINTLLHEGVYMEPRAIKKITLKEEIKFDDTTANSIYRKEPVLDTSVAQQMANIMSDYNSRTPSVWGNLKRNLELDGWTGANQVAAKTGTTNDVKDIWTVGGSPYYTVVAWMGNTDGKVMNQKISGASEIAPIWKRIMTEIHKDKEKTGFNSNSLEKVNIDPVSGMLGGGSSELINKNQLKKLQNAEKNFKNSAYNPITKSIFDNRTPISSRKLKVNLLDGKAIPNSDSNNTSVAPISTSPNQITFPESLMKEVACTGVISEFPNAQSWLNPAQNIKIKTNETGNCPTETSDMNLENYKPKITTNLKANLSSPEEILITADSGIDNNLLPEPNKIIKIEFYLGAELITSEVNVVSLTIDVQKLGLSGVKDVRIVVEDRFGLKTELILEKVDFDDLIFSSSSSSKSSSKNSSTNKSNSSLSSSVNSSTSSTSMASSSLKPSSASSIIP
jgi:penicillin-binding protein 1A